jgi:hypothetical protein
MECVGSGVRIRLSPLLLSFFLPHTAHYRTTIRPTYSPASFTVVRILPSRFSGTGYVPGDGVARGPAAVLRFPSTPFLPGKFPSTLPATVALYASWAPVSPCSAPRAQAVPSAERSLCQTPPLSEVLHNSPLCPTHNPAVIDINQSQTHCYSSISIEHRPLVVPDINPARTIGSHQSQIFGR